MRPPKPNTFITRRSPFTTPTPAAPPRRACSGAKFGVRLAAALDELIGALTAADTLAGLRDVIVRGKATLGLAQPLRASLPQELHSTFDTLGARLAEGNSDLRALEGGRLTALTALDVALVAAAVQDAQLGACQAVVADSLQACARARTRTRAQAHAHAHARVHTHAHACTHTHTHACTRTRTHTHAHACTDLGTHARTRAPRHRPVTARNRRARITARRRAHHTSQVELLALLRAIAVSELADRRPFIDLARTRQEGGPDDPHSSTTAVALAIAGDGAAQDAAWAAPPPAPLRTPRDLQEALTRAHDPADLRRLMAGWLASVVNGGETGSDQHHNAAGWWRKAIGAQAVRQSDGGTAHDLAQWLHAQLEVGPLPQHAGSRRARAPSAEAQTRTQLRHAELLALCDGLLRANLTKDDLARRMANAPERDVSSLRVLIFVSRPCCNVCQVVLVAFARVFGVGVKVVQSVSHDELRTSYVGP